MSTIIVMYPGKFLEVWIVGGEDKNTFNDGLTSQNTCSVPGKKRTGYRVVSSLSKHDGKNTVTLRRLPFNSSAS